MMNVDFVYRLAIITHSETTGEENVSWKEVPKPKTNIVLEIKT